MRYAKHNKITILCMAIIIIISAIMLPTCCFGADNETLTFAEELDTSVLQELDQIDFSALDDTLMFEENSNMFSITNIKDKVYSIISGEQALDYSNFFACVISQIFSSFVKYLPMLSLIVGIGIISNILTGIKSKVGEKSTSNLVHLVCFLSVVTIIITAITQLSQTTSNSLDSMVGQINIIFPILLTLMVGLKANVSVATFQPIFAIMTTYVCDFFKFLILPLFLTSFVFNLISNLSDNIKLDKFNDLIMSIFKWSVGLVFSLFFTIITFQSISAGKFDSISLRTTKYTIKSYVPIMGSYLSDGMDLIVASSVLIKNTVGLVGVMLILSTIITPILELVMFNLILKLVSAVVQPLGDNKMSNFLSGTSKSITILSTSIIAIGFMYILSMGLVMVSANVVV